VPANPYDSVYCVRLGLAAVHAAMCRRIKMVVGWWAGASAARRLRPRGNTAQRLGYYPWT
jgi:6-phosphofructokinase